MKRILIAVVLCVCASSAKAQFAVFDPVDFIFDQLMNLATEDGLAEVKKILEETEEIYDTAVEIREQAERIRETLEDVRPEALFRLGSDERYLLRRYVPGVWEQLDDAVLLFNYDALPSSQQEWAWRAYNLMDRYDLQYDSGYEVYRTSWRNPNGFGERAADNFALSGAYAGAAMATAEESFGRTEERMETMEELLMQLAQSEDAKLSTDLLVRGQGQQNELEAERIRLAAMLLRQRAARKAEELDIQLRTGRAMRLEEDDISTEQW